MAHVANRNYFEKKLDRKIKKLNKDMAKIKRKPKLKKIKENKTKYKNKADKLMSLFVRKLGRCERCGKQANLQAAHVITRSNLRLRYDIQNVMCLCAGCHMWWHHEPLEAGIWFNQCWPDRFNYLMKVKNEINKMTVDSYKEVIKQLEDYV